MWARRLLIGSGLAVASLIAVPSAAGAAELRLDVRTELFGTLRPSPVNLRPVKPTSQLPATLGTGPRRRRPRLRPPVFPSPVRTWKSWPWWESVRFWPAAC